MNIENGKHKILFTCGKLYLDDVQIAGEGILPQKDVCVEFNVEKKEEVQKDPSILEINVVDKMAFKDVGPGQR